VRIDVWIGIITFAMAVLGGIVSAHAPSEPKHKWVYGIAFAVLGVLAILLTIKQSNETAESNAALQRNIKSLRAEIQEDSKYITKLPSAADVVREFKNSEITELSRSQGIPPPASVAGRGTGLTTKTTVKKTLIPAQGDTADKVSKGIEELKSLIVGQRWGLTADQMVVLSQRMAPYATTFNAWRGGGDLITAILGNPDSTRFAFSLVAALRTAGWNLPGSGFSQGVFSGNPVGFIVQIHSLEDAGIPALNQLLATVKEDGIQCHGEIAATVPAGQFRIVVGAKPE
jgi:hypothetical protein